MANNAKHEENDGVHLTKIIGSVPCPHHGADIGDACWNLLSARGLLRAICGRRARSAGCNGRITSKSNRTSQKG